MTKADLHKSPNDIQIEEAAAAPSQTPVHRVLEIRHIMPSVSISMSTNKSKSPQCVLDKKNAAPERIFQRVYQDLKTDINGRKVQQQQSDYLDSKQTVGTIRRMTIESKCTFDSTLDKS